METLESLQYKKNISLFFSHYSLQSTVRILLEELGKKLKRMPKKIISVFVPNPKKKRPNVHSKNASVGQKGYKKKYRGQGR